MLRKIVWDEVPVALYRGMGRPWLLSHFRTRWCSRSMRTYLERSMPRILPKRALLPMRAWLWAESAAVRTLVRSSFSCRTPANYLNGRSSTVTDVPQVSEVDIPPRGHPGNVPRPYHYHEQGRSIGVYFWTSEYMRGQLHPNCRANGDENLRMMLVAGGSAWVASWIFCYPLDVVKTRLQVQSELSRIKYKGIVDCFQKSVRDDGYGVLWRVRNSGGPSVCSQRSHIFYL